MIEPAEPAPQTLGAGLAPMMFQVHAMAKVRVKKVAKSQIALQGLYEIGLCAAAKPVKQVTEGRHEVINDKEQGQGPGGRRHAYKPYLLRAGIFELDSEDGKFMLPRKSTKHRQMAAPNGIVARYFVVEDGDAQGRVSFRKQSTGKGNGRLTITRMPRSGEETGLLYRVRGPATEDLSCRPDVGHWRERGSFRTMTRGFRDAPIRKYPRCGNARRHAFLWIVRPALPLSSWTERTIEMEW